MSEQGNNRVNSMGDHGKNEVILFWGCFFALVATAFSFVVRGQVIGDWETVFNLSETQKGEILGVGLWPFALSIVLFSLVIDKLGYGKAMVFAFVCHGVSTIIIIFATSYEMLYWGTFIVALGNGTVEAVINPVAASMFPREKTKWLNILHAGWPGGLVLGGILAIFFADASWKFKIGLIFLPMAIYAVLLIGRKFPIHERVLAGVSFRDMLREPGYIGAFIVVSLMVLELGRVFEWTKALQIGLIVVLVGAYAAYVRTAGRPLFIFLALIMFPLATTELGTDSWITDLMTPEMKEFGLHAGWVLVYTSLIMMILRFCAGPIVERISPLGLLAVSSGVAVVGLVFLSKATGIMILLAATIYAFGKTFFWPTMLGVAGDRFPKGGALTLNMIGGTGTLCVGIVGSAFLGNIQDRAIDKNLMEASPEIHAKVTGEPQLSIFGTYQAVDQEKLDAASEEEKAQLSKIQAVAKKDALATVAAFPAVMLICYLILIFYFRSIGGYKAEILVNPSERKEETV